MVGPYTSRDDRVRVIQCLELGLNTAEIVRQTDLKRRTVQNIVARYKRQGRKRSKKILHRDMKAANVLITKTGTLKLADFGLARAFSQRNGQPNRYTNRVVTLWYRPPELLLGERNYGPPIDLWGAGCIMAEMWTRTPIMQGSTEQHQLNLISQLCGSITPEVWPGVENLPLYSTMELAKNHKRKVKERLKPYVRDPHACDLIDKMLTLEYADCSLNHDFFWMDPLPCDLGKMLSHHTHSMFEFLATPRRGKQQQQQQPPPQSQQSQASHSSQQLPSSQSSNQSQQGASRRSGHRPSASARVASMSSCPERIF
ncbi:cyclin-dependent kinase 9-like [Macrobrachium nipponense]|uniref:cyclin-dependent kinase 9-like n=1 Tax=Macrobrachium nipponense TaxID=159736 RepID=UPI0030C7A901